MHKLQKSSYIFNWKPNVDPMQKKPKMENVNKQMQQSHIYNLNIFIGIKTEKWRENIFILNRLTLNS